MPTDSFEERLARSGVTPEYVEMTMRQQRMNAWLDRVLPELSTDDAGSTPGTHGFGEISVDAETSVIALTWKGDVPAHVTAALENPPAGVSVVVTAVPYSLRQLEGAVQRVIGGRRELDATLFAAGVNRLSTDVEGGRIVVYYQHPDVAAGRPGDPAEQEARRVSLLATLTERARLPVTLIEHEPGHPG